MNSMVLSHKENIKMLGYLLAPSYQKRKWRKDFEDFELARPDDFDLQYSCV